jgi:LacI family transcriptional regulator, galactose operon repressor
MGRLLSSRTRPTGVYVSNLNQAIGALACARRSGVRVPHDLSIVAYDDDPLAEFLEVPLTAIKMPLGELGRAAIAALAAQIDGERPHDFEVTTAPELVLRASTAPPASPAASPAAAAPAAVTPASSPAAAELVAATPSGGSE